MLAGASNPVPSQVPQPLGGRSSSRRSVPSGFRPGLEHTGEDGRLDSFSLRFHATAGESDSFEQHVPEHHVPEHVVEESLLSLAVTLTWKQRQKEDIHPPLRVPERV